MTKKPYSEYPKMVYGPYGERKVITCAEETPEGYMTFEERQSAEDPVQRVVAAQSKAKGARASERAKLIDFLNAHNVDFDPKLGIARLRELADQLTAFLEAQGVTGGDSA